MRQCHSYVLSITVVDLSTFFQGGNLNKHCQGVVSLMWLAVRHFGVGSDLLLDLNACHNKSIHNFFDLFIFVFNNNVVRVCVGPCRGFKFSLG